MVISLERGADLHMAQLMPLPLTVSCFSKILIGFAFLVLAHPGSPGQRAVKRVCVLLFSLFIFTLLRLYLEIRDSWRPGAGLAGMRDSMGQIRDIPENPGRVATIAFSDVMIC